MGYMRDLTGKRLDTFEVADGLAQRRRRPFPLPQASPVTAVPPTYTYGKGSGISAASIANGGSGYAVGDFITIAGGTSTIAGRLRVTGVNAGAITAVAIDLAGVYSVNPPTPATQATTSGAGTGATFNLTLNGGSGSGQTSGFVVWGPQSAGVEFYGNGPTASGGMTTGNGTQSAFTFCTDALTMDIRMTALNSEWQVFIDGERLAATPFSTDTSGARYFLTLAFTARRVRTIRVVGYNMSFAGVTVPASASVWTPIEPRKPRAWVLGDSYTFGTGAIDKSAAANCIMAEELGLELITDGIGGASWTGSTAGTPAERVAAKLATLNKLPEVVFLDLGYNNSTSTPDATAIGNAINATVAAVRSAAPNARIIMFGPATPLGPTSNLTSLKTIMSGRAAALGIAYVDVEGWVTANNKSIYTDGDNVHPTTAGHFYLGERKARAVALLLDRAA